MAASRTGAESPFFSALSANRPLQEFSRVAVRNQLQARPQVAWRGSGISPELCEKNKAQNLDSRVS